MINGELHKLELTKGFKDGAEDEESRTYTSQYSTIGFDVSKSGKRQEMLLVLEVRIPNISLHKDIGFRLITQ